MRGFLVLAGVLFLAAFVVAPTAQQEEEHQVDPNQHETLDSTEQQDLEHGQDQPNDGQDAEENVFASVELAATNADLAIKLMKQALGVLLESSANAMESTEELLRSGVSSVNSIASGAQAAAKQIGLMAEQKPAPKVQRTIPKETKPARAQRNGWFW